MLFRPKKRSSDWSLTVTNQVHVFTNNKIANKTNSKTALPETKYELGSEENGKLKYNSLV